MNKFEEMQKSFKKAEDCLSDQKLSIRYVELLISKGTALKRVSTDKAIKAFEQALDINFTLFKKPINVAFITIILALGQIYITLNKCKEAEKMVF